MLKREYEVDHDEDGNKTLRVPLSLMDGQSPKPHPILHKPGMLGEEEAPEVTQSYAQAEAALSSAWKGNPQRPDTQTVPEVTGNPYEDAELWLANAWKGGA
jgi:hypothetical protein